MKYIILSLLTLYSLSLSAQNEYKAGNISISSEINNQLVTVTVELTTGDINTPIDSINICFGDGKCKWITPSIQEINPNLDLINSVFITDHLYPAQSHYIISISDCCWSDTGLNTSGFGNSLFFLSREHSILNPQFFTYGSSPKTSKSINLITAIENQILNYSPQFYDADGDSIVINLVSPIGDSIISNNYLFPNEILPSTNNDFFISETNEINWDRPQEQGEYQFAYELLEYRNGLQFAKSYGVALIIVENTTPTNELYENKLNIFPNPTNGILQIEGEPFDEIEIYNLMGRKVYSNNNANTTNRINLVNLPNGMYFLSLMQNGKVFSEVIIKSE